MLQSQATSLRNMEVQIDRLAKELKNRPRGVLPSGLVHCVAAKPYLQLIVEKKVISKEQQQPRYLKKKMKLHIRMN